jgi:hypothetical protein
VNQGQATPIACALTSSWRQAHELVARASKGMNPSVALALQEAAGMRYSSDSAGLPAPAGRHPGELRTLEGIAGLSFP